MGRKWDDVTTCFENFFAAIAGRILFGACPTGNVPGGGRRQRHRPRQATAPGHAPVRGKRRPRSPGQVQGPAVADDFLLLAGDDAVATGEDRRRVEVREARGQPGEFRRPATHVLVERSVQSLRQRLEVTGDARRIGAGSAAGDERGRRAWRACAGWPAAGRRRGGAADGTARHGDARGSVPGAAAGVPASRAAGRAGRVAARALAAARIGGWRGGRAARSARVPPARRQRWESAPR
jgi:hypothetical protein